MYKVVCIYSHYPDMGMIAKEMFPPESFYVEAAEGVLDAGVRLAQRYEKQGFDLIISRGVTGKMIQKTVGIPVIIIETTHFDILIALHQAKDYGKKIAYLLYHDDLPKEKDVDSMRQILGVDASELRLFLFANETEIDRILEHEVDATEYVVVGSGSYILNRAKARGFSCVMVSSRREAIYKAMSEARSTMEVLQKSQRHMQALHSLMDVYTAGLIMLDGQMHINYISPSAAEIFHLQPELLMNWPFDDAFAQTPLRGINEQHTCTFPFSVDQSLKAVRHPLFNGSERVGYAITLEYVDHDDNSQALARIRSDNSRQRRAKYELADLLGNSPAIRSVKERALRYSESDLTVLIIGESGTGKEIVANGIHNASPRRDKPFVAINCAALSPSLLESELFGYEDGAFTGAKRGGRPGLFAQADGGTIFLDEIADISLNAQAQLLRVLQEKTIRPVGGNRAIMLNVRVIAATNVDLWEMTQKGKFREDLFYRLNMLYLNVPPLRERLEDIPALFQVFLDRYRGPKLVTISDDRTRLLQSYDWPGNVRELISFVQKYVMLYSENGDNRLLVSELLDEFASLHHPEKKAERRSLPVCEDRENWLMIRKGTLREMEDAIVSEYLKSYGERRSQMAEALGISRSGLWKKIKELET